MNRRVIKLSCTVIYSIALISICSTIIAFSQEIKPGFMRDKESLVIFCYGGQESYSVCKTIEYSFKDKFNIILLNQIDFRGHTINLDTFKKIGKEKGTEKGILIQIRNWKEEGEQKWEIVSSYFIDILNDKVLSTSNQKKLDRLIIEAHKIFPAGAKIIEIKNNIVTIDAGRNLGILRNKRYEVIKYNKKVGLVEVNSVYDAYSQGKIKRGGSNITPGAIIVEKAPLRSSLIFSYSKFPINIVPNQKYINISGESPKRFGSMANFPRIGIMKCIENGYPSGGFEATIGWASLGSWGALQGDINIFFFRELFPELLYLKLRTGLGLGLSFAEQKWQRLQGNYDDDIGRNQGKALSLFTGTYNIACGLHLFLSPKFSIFLNYGYLGYGGYGGEWQDTEYEKKVGDETKNFYVKENWLEYEVKKTGGMSFEAGISFWRIF